MSKPIAITSENAAELLQPVFDAAREKFLSDMKESYEGMETRVLEKASEKFAPIPDEEGTSNEENDTPSVEDRLSRIEEALSDLKKSSRKSNQPEETKHTPAPQSKDSDKGLDVDHLVGLLAGKKETN